jgi:hypothetical protein
MILEATREKGLITCKEKTFGLAANHSSEIINIR